MLGLQAVLRTLANMTWAGNTGVERSFIATAQNMSVREILTVSYTAVLQQC
jgi:hypothetical protein